MQPLKQILFRIVLAAAILLPLSSTFPKAGSASAQSPVAAGPNKIYVPLLSRPQTADLGVNWPQLGHDPQRTGATPLQVDPPYCYAWKWNAVPVASRAQPIVMNGNLYIGGMDGRLYARNASTGQPLWNYATGGPIRHSPAATPTAVITSSYDGYTYALSPSNGSVLWKTFTGSSATAPLIDERYQRVFVASTYGKMTALNLSNGFKLWEYSAAAAILTSPALSSDAKTIFFGSEAISAIALDAATGALTWQTALQGQSLADRYPVVAGNSVLYRSQPYYFFYNLLQTWGDAVMDQAGALNANWGTDWANVRPNIVNFLNANPSKQTMFVLNAASGASQGTPPVLYTYGSNDIANMPVVSNNNIYLTYRARHGIQTDYPPIIHVTTKYDAELGKMNLSNLDITGLTASSSTALTIPLTGGPGFRMTSDEAAMLTMGGNILWVDNWERLGGLNVSSGQVVHAGNVSNNWPECFAQCGPAGPKPFFPLSGNAADPAYPFPTPRTTEGHARSGAVIANNMVYWHVVDAGLAAFTHSQTSTCPTPQVWTDSGGALYPAYDIPAQPAVVPPLQNYVTTDLTTPVAVSTQNQDLVDRLNNEVSNLLTAANGNHLMPYFLERGLSSPRVWPYNTSNTGLPEIAYISHGNVFWQDPGELLLSMAQAYPYLTAPLKTQLVTYMQGEMTRYPPMQNLPYNNPSKDWLHSGAAREPYPLAVRSSLNNWPPVAANISAIYSLWLWSKNINDWSYAQTHWAEVQSLFNARSATAGMLYYADIAGAIGYYRLATHFNNTAEAAKGLNAAVAAMQAGLNFATYRDRAKTDYPDPRGETTGWSAPLFFGMTPEVGRYLKEQFNGQAANHLIALESLNSSGLGLLWWYITRAGEHAENGETAFLLPSTAWSHFLGHAYIVGNPQAALRKWLDRPWVAGDLYSIQKIAATIQAPP